MNSQGSDELLLAVAKLRHLFPDWRLTQLVANLATAAGALSPEAMWDLEDKQLLAAAQRLIERNEIRTAARA